MTFDRPAEPAHTFVPDRTNSALRMADSLRLPVASQLWRELRAVVDAAQPGGRLDFDLSGVERLDGAVMALLWQLRSELQRRGIDCDFVGAAPRVRDIIDLYRDGEGAAPPLRRRPRAMLAQIGDATVTYLRETQRMLGFIGEIAIAGWGLLRSPRTGNFRAVPGLVERAGADAVPIVMLINFLVGLVMAFQASTQLRNFGASVFVANLIGISMTRELGPLMTAIVLTGRSGAAFAAELGTMKVNEEIDALRTMGFGPLRYLVMPRIAALMLVMPVLSLLADVLGIIGGLVVAMSSLDLTPGVYAAQLRKAVQPSDVYSGLIKSVLFGFSIALIASQQGLCASGGAEGVGRRTTTAVVSALFSLILIDTAYTFIFRMLES